MDPKTAKSSLRSSIKDRLSHLSDGDRLAESRSICRRILESLPPEPVTIAAYFPLKDEVDMRPLFEELKKRGDTIYLPKVENQKMVFRLMGDVMDLKKGSFGTYEPEDDSPLLDPKTLNIALIPARAFDIKGNRTGRGNGGYDIWIRAQRKLNPTTKFFGIALECQIVHDIPMEAHDERVDAIVTARGIVHVERT